MAGNEKTNAGGGSIVKNALILLAFTLLAGLILAMVYHVTKGPIERAQAEATAKAYAKVYADASLDTDNAALMEAIEAFQPDDRDALLKEGYTVNGGEGYVFTSSAKGYGGEVVLAVGVETGGRLRGVYVISADDETPGLGTKCKQDWFLEQFAGMAAGEDGRIRHIAADGSPQEYEFNQISGATLTSAAVERAVNAVLKFVEEYESSGTSGAGQ